MNVILFFLAMVAIGWVAFWFLETRFQGYRTVILNFIQGVPVFGAALVDLLDQYQVSEVVPEKYMWGYLAGVIVLNIVFRMGTTSPMGQRPSGDTGGRAR